MTKFLFSLFAGLAFPLATTAIELPDVISNNMVLQQQSNALLWGWAKPGSHVKVTPGWDAKASAIARAQDDGRWEVRISTPNASFRNYEILIEGDGQRIRLTDVLVGEVWLASGQSNMEMPLDGFWGQPVDGANETIAHAAAYADRIRMATVPKTQRSHPQRTATGRWQKSLPSTAPRMSAAAYFFARELGDILNVPVGIICNAYGGSAVESWLPESILRTYPDVDWKAVHDSTKWSWNTPELMYNAMLWPLRGYTVRGVLWNQGETNVGHHATYPERFAAMAAEWRRLWNQPDMPFITVELPPYIYGDGADGTGGALFRQCQWHAAELAAPCEIVCSADLSTPDEPTVIHPRKKLALGQRLAYKSATKIYGVEGIGSESPRFTHAEMSGPKATLHFTDAAGGFHPRDNLRGFEVRGADGIWHPAKARHIDGLQECTIEVEHPSGADVRGIRYAWHNWHTANVHNCRQLPLVPFCSDDNTAFVTVHGNHFFVGDTPYKYVGTNFWYGPIIASEGQGGDRPRLHRELDSLCSLGVRNLRILVGGEGPEGRASHIAPLLQTAPGVYNDTLLQGLDYLLAEMGRRDMHAVLYMNNAWEWSGGYTAYLEWAGRGKAAIPSVDGYQAYVRYASQFVLCDEALRMALNHVKFIVSRRNSVTGRAYADDPAIMAWQVANEPRSFSDKGKDALLRYIDTTARLIHHIDPNHLVSTGSEGLNGCEVDLDLWTRIHSLPSIDYGILHLWPTNWGWADSATLTTNMDKVLKTSDEYIGVHQKALPAKPIVLEEFGYPRDHMKLAPGSPTTARDTFYAHILGKMTGSESLDGCNFWGWGGLAMPRHNSWQPWDPYTGDPAQEPQGLFSVFSADQSTIAIIKNAAEKTNKTK